MDYSKRKKLKKEEESGNKMTKRYAWRYDSTYDDEKLIWLESICGDPECDYCKDRPMFPVKELTDPLVEDYVLVKDRVPKEDILENP